MSQFMKAIAIDTGDLPVVYNHPTAAIYIGDTAGDLEVVMAGDCSDPASAGAADTVVFVAPSLGEILTIKVISVVSAPANCIALFETPRADIYTE